MLKWQIYGVLASMSSDPFDYLTGKKGISSVDATGITNDATILGMGASFVNLFTVVGAIGTVLSLIFCGYKIVLFKKDPRQLTETKRELITKCSIAVVIFAFMAIAGVIFAIVRQTTLGVQ